MEASKKYIKIFIIGFLVWNPKRIE